MEKSMQDYKYTSTEVMTAISAKHWDFITQDNLSVKEAVEFLKNGMQIRTFKDNICQIYQKDDYETKLVDGLYAISEFEYEKKTQIDSVKRKVRNWLSGKNNPTDRDEVFRICFALDLDIEQSERLLTRQTEQGIHYRNGKEMIFAYCLKYHLGYENAIRLEMDFYHKKEEKNSYENPVTHVFKYEFQKIKAEEDLLSFIMSHKMQLGNSHNTAYEYFCKMLAVLSGENLEEEKYSMESIADLYLRLNVPEDKKTSGYSNVQKIVKKYWPGARAIKAMKSRSEDVNRKTLLLLYIVTGGMSDETYNEIDEYYSGSEEFLEYHCKKMNRMLKECGMSRIDPRNIFDYLVMYCLRPEEEIFMSDRMALLMSEIFEETTL